MTAFSTALARPRADSLVGWRGAAVVAVALAAIVGARWSATRIGLDPLAVGAAFGFGLLLVAWLSRTGPSTLGPHRPAVDPGRIARAIAIGCTVGLALVVVTIVGPVLAGTERVAGVGRPALAFVPWALVTAIVATAEEAVLRGVLFAHVERAGGVVLAVGVTTVVFGLLHVPLYGWHVVPLDLAVGLCLGGLRLTTRSVAAPAAAHVVADLASWWL